MMTEPNGDAGKARTMAALSGALSKQDFGRVATLAAKLVPVVEAAAAPLSVASVLDAWEREGPLVHEPTGIETLDAKTGGGPVYGTRWYLLGQPDACKTALVAQIADVYLARGLVVGMLCIDEEPSDVTGRFLQRRGLGRVECEQRSALTMARARDALPELAGLRMYDASWTIERAAEDTAKAAAAAGKRAAFFTDSIQAAASQAPGDATSIREAVSAQVRAFREAATKHRLIGIATSEMGRGHYIANADADDMAAAKESGAIEYSARVMLAMRAAPNEDDLFGVKIAKNKHGKRGDSIGLRLDRRLMVLSEADPPEETDRSEAREQARIAREDGRNRTAAVAAVGLLVARPGLSSRYLTSELRARLGSCSTALAEAALAVLGAAVVVVAGPRGARNLYLNGQALPPSVVAALDAETKPRALGSRAPKEATSHD